MITEADVLRDRIKQNIQITACISKGHIVEITKDINESISYLKAEFQSNPTDKLQNKINHLTIMKAELLDKIDICDEKK